MKTRAVSATIRFLKPVALAICGMSALTASSHLAVPMYPVPVTMQTAVVLLLGAICGAGMGSGIVIGWLGLAFLGAPVLADGMGGPQAFVGPTAGYLASFPIVAFLAGFLTRNKNWAGMATRFAGFTALHALILGMGAMWLGYLFGAQTAWGSGVAPFLIGAILKSGLAAALVSVIPNFRNR